MNTPHHVPHIIWNENTNYKQDESLTTNTMTDSKMSQLPCHSLKEDGVPNEVATLRKLFSSF